MIQPHPEIVTGSSARLRRSLLLSTVALALAGCGGSGTQTGQSSVAPDATPESAHNHGHNPGENGPLPTDPTSPTPAATPGTLSVLGAHPAGQDVDAASPIQVFFSAPADKASVQSAFTGTPAIACAWAWSEDARRATCTPRTPLKTDTAYTVQLGTGARAQGGSALKAAWTRQFRTNKGDALQTGVVPSKYAVHTGPDDGTFRIQCFLSRVAKDDPIVYPGQPGRAHLHYFFGSTTVDAFSTSETLSTSGGSTCPGQALNRTAYWMPAMLRGDGVPILPHGPANFYYKNTGIPEHLRAQVRPMPTGLKMIVGDVNGRPVPEPPPYRGSVAFACEDRDKTGKAVAHPGWHRGIPDCAAGHYVRMDVIFRSCWDGVNLDSPDHQSHMAEYIYNNALKRRECPATHPVVLPVVTEFMFFKVTEPTGTKGWHLSSDMYDWKSTRGGYSLHADWMMGWNPQIVQRWTKNCLNGRQHSANGYLCDSYVLSRHQANPDLKRPPGAVGDPNFGAP